MKKIVCLFAITLVTSIGAQNALAMPQFKKAFAEKFAAKHPKKEFQSAVKKATCNACHVKGAKKTVQNEYGKLLAKLIEGDANKRYKAAKAKGSDAGKAELAKIMGELDKAFDKSLAAKSEAGKGPKYGELIKAGKLPVDPAKAEAAYKAEKAKAKSAGK